MICENVLNERLKNSKDNINELKSKLISELIIHTEELTGRRPIILPVIIDINR